MQFNVHEGSPKAGLPSPVVYGHPARRFWETGAYRLFEWKDGVETPFDGDIEAYWAIADSRVEKVIRIFTEAVAATVNATDAEELAQAALSGDRHRAEMAVPWKTFEEELMRVVSPLSFVSTRSRWQAAEFLWRDLGWSLPPAREKKAAGDNPGDPPMVVSAFFNRTNPHSLDWIRAHAAELVTQVSQESMLAIRDIIHTAFDPKTAMHPRESAKLIRQHIGLTSRQSSTLDRYRQQLVADGVRGKRLDSMVEAYRKKMIRRRAENIARTETIRASAEGQQRLWEDSAEQGYIDGALTKRIWIMHRDGRECKHVCPPMKGQLKGMKEPFITGIGDSVMTPPAHPSCRCAIGLKPVAAAQPSDASEPSPPPPPPPPAVQPEVSFSEEENVTVRKEMLQQLTPAQAAAVKTQAVERIAQRMRSLPMDDFLIAMGREDLIGSAAASQEVANLIVNTWNFGTGGADELATALQLRAKREFGISAAAMGHFDPLAARAAGAFGQSHAGILDPFLRAQYEETQGWLSSRNITEMTLFRGMRIASSFPAAGELAKLKFQPLSSFTTDVGAAVSYGLGQPAEKGGQILITLRLPASRIFSLGATGMGSIGKAEVIALGGQYTAFVLGGYGKGFGVKEFLAALTSFLAFGR
jgi:hypothetical protein